MFCFIRHLCKKLDIVGGTRKRSEWPNYKPVRYILQFSILEAGDVVKSLYELVLKCWNITFLVSNIEALFKVLKCTEILCLQELSYTGFLVPQWTNFTTFYPMKELCKETHPPTTTKLFRSLYSPLGIHYLSLKRPLPITPLSLIHPLPVPFSLSST